MYRGGPGGPDRWDRAPPRKEVRPPYDDAGRPRDWNRDRPPEMDRGEYVPSDRRDGDRNRREGGDRWPPTHPFNPAPPPFRSDDPRFSHTGPEERRAYDGTHPHPSRESEREAQGRGRSFGSSGRESFSNNFSYNPRDDEWEKNGSKDRYCDRDRGREGDRSSAKEREIGLIRDRDPGRDREMDRSYPRDHALDPRALLRAANPGSLAGRDSLPDVTGSATVGDKGAGPFPASSVVQNTAPNLPPHDIGVAAFSMGNMPATSAAAAPSSAVVSPSPVSVPLQSILTKEVPMDASSAVPSSEKRSHGDMASNSVEPSPSGKRVRLGWGSGLAKRSSTTISNAVVDASQEGSIAPPQGSADADVPRSGPSPPLPISRQSSEALNGPVEGPSSSDLKAWPGGSVNDLSSIGRSVSSASTSRRVLDPISMDKLDTAYDIERKNDSPISRPVSAALEPPSEPLPSKEEILANIDAVDVEILHTELQYVTKKRLFQIKQRKLTGESLLDDDDDAYNMRLPLSASVNVDVLIENILHNNSHVYQELMDVLTASLPAIPSNLSFDRAAMPIKSDTLFRDSVDVAKRHVLKTNNCVRDVVSQHRLSIQAKELSLRQEYLAHYEKWKSNKNRSRSRIASTPGGSRRSQRSADLDFANGVTGFSSQQYAEAVSDLTFANAVDEARRLDELYGSTVSEIPPMIIDEYERDLLKFRSYNGLIPDPKFEEALHFCTNPWTEDESKLFVEKYLLYPKNFRKIALSLPFKDVLDCIQFYYENKIALGLKRLVREQRTRPGRRALESIKMPKMITSLRPYFGSVMDRLLTSQSDDVGIVSRSSLLPHVASSLMKPESPKPIVKLETADVASTPDTALDPLQHLTSQTLLLIKSEVD